MFNEKKWYVHNTRQNCVLTVIGLELQPSIALIRYFVSCKRAKLDNIVRFGDDIPCSREQRPLFYAPRVPNNYFISGQDMFRQNVVGF